MFGQNEIVGRKFFKDMPAGTLYVTSIFYTLQGEGPFMGLPAVFVRLGKCNLDCSFCDTYFDHGDVMTFEEIEAKIAATMIHVSGVKQESVVLVITGGEPTLQSNLIDFVISQANSWSAIQVETNGTQPEVTAELSEDATIVVSPKCLEKDGKPERYLLLPKTTLDVAGALKFVVSADPNSPYHEVPGWVRDWGEAWALTDVYISPMNVYLDKPRETKIALMRDKPSLQVRSEVIERVSFWEPGLLDQQANQKNHEYAAWFCMQYGYRLNLQMHLYASIP